MALVGVGWDRGSTYRRGAREAPAAVRRALHSSASSLMTEGGLNLAAETRFVDAGDLELPDSDDEGARRRIREHLASLLARGAAPLVLGGDHSITYPVVEAVAGSRGPLDILLLDAHPDLYPEYEGRRLSHASPFARILEDSLARRLVAVGVRTVNEVQAQTAARHSVEILPMQSWREVFELRFEAPLYVSVDVDVLDPAFAPGVSHREPGGLSVRELLEVLHALPLPPVAADVVEINPRRDLDGVTATVGAKLVKELAGLLLARG